MQYQNALYFLAIRGIASSVCCLLALWLGLLHGYYPARRLRTIAVCVALLGVLWLGRRWLGDITIRITLVMALLFATFGTVSGWDMQATNRSLKGALLRQDVQLTHRTTTQCFIFGLPPCRTYISPHIERPYSLYQHYSAEYYYESKCPLPYFLCVYSVGQE